MAIREVEKEGKKSFEVFVHIRSSLNSKIRVQKRRTNLTTLRQAQGVEKELIKECSAEVARLEGSALPFVELVDRFEMGLKNDEIIEGLTRRQPDTLRELISDVRSFTKEWNRKLSSEITPNDVRTILKKMKDSGYSRSRLKTIKGGINLMFKWGIQEGVLPGVQQSPAAVIVLGRTHEEKPPQILNLGEIHHLLESADRLGHVWYPIWFLALHTGMRSGELYSLEWADIDFDLKLITCSKSYNGRLKKIKSTKGGYWRKIPMSGEVEALLKDLKAKAVPSEPWVLPRITAWKRGEQARVIREFCKEIGISSVYFHTLRACFATHLLNAGVSSSKVQKIGGWTDSKVMSRYNRLAGIEVRGATDVLNFVRKEEKPTQEIVNEESSNNDELDQF